MVQHRIILAAAFSLATGASAQALQISAEQRASCTPDALRLCSSEIPDIARVTACMKANRANLSQRCQATFASVETTKATPRHTAASAHAAPPSGHVTGGETPRRHRYASAAIYHRHHGHAGWSQSAQAMAIARQVMGGLGMACASQTIPSDICSMSAGFMGGNLPY
jgi:hypothetical protein